MGDINNMSFKKSKKPKTPVPDGEAELLMFETRREIYNPETDPKPKEELAVEIEEPIEEITAAEDNKNTETELLSSDPQKADKIEAFEVEDPHDDETERAAWGGKLQFIFTCIGYAVGLGNVWRFPYLCYKNGGGAFLLPYIIMLALVGLPLFYLELAFGQFGSLGPISIWRINPLFKGLGYAMVAVSWLIAVYYNVVISHVMLYLFASFASIPTGLPWISCDNSWNTQYCIQPKYGNETNTNVTLSDNITAADTKGYGIVTEATDLVTTVAAVMRNNKTIERTPAEEYYNYFVLEMSESIDDFGAVNWKLALCLLLAWLVVLVCLIRGIQSLGKVVYFTAIFPYVMLTILFIRGVTLDGAVDGIIFYLKPDFSRLSDPRVWSDAATQIFYSLSACSGGLIAMASYNKFENNCYKDAIIVSLINCATSLYAGFVIFAILGFIANEKGVPVGEVVEGGPGLAFVVYPEAISHMPAPQLWAIFFFFMMATLGFGSQFSIVECVLSALSDEFVFYLDTKWKSILFRTGIIMATFLLGLPMVTKGGIYLLTLVDYSVSGFPLLFVGLLELIALMYIYGFSEFGYNIELMLGKPPNWYWRICWMVLSPLIIILTILFNCIFYKPPDLSGYLYPGWAQALGWCIAMWPILMIPGYFLVKFCMGGGWKLMWELMEPAKEWGPSSAIHKKRYHAAKTVPLTPDIKTSDQRFTFEGAQPSRRSIADINAMWNKDDDEVFASNENVAADKPSKSKRKKDKSKNTKILRIKIDDSNFDTNFDSNCDSNV